MAGSARPPAARAPWLGAALVLSLLGRATAFFEEIFSQMGGDGGGFQFVGGSPFGGGQRIQKPKWPKKISQEITKQFSWLKGTEWSWNNWRNVKFEKDGTFDAPTRDCQTGMCNWAASGGKIYILWGEAGMHELAIQGDIPTSQDQAKMKGLRMKGKRHSDGDRVTAVYARIFDFEAAALDVDLYEVMGLPDDASEQDIKKVYRKLSIRYHPDKNPDEASKQKFAQIRDAYEVLNDPDKKILYDTGGLEAVKKAEKGEIEKGEDVEVTMKVSLADLYLGSTRQARINRRVVCRGCRKDPKGEKCRTCQRCPSEVRMVQRQMGPGMFVQQQERVESKEYCKNAATTLDAVIERGMKSGDKITFNRMAEQKPNTIPGNAIVTLEVSDNAGFQRFGNDLHLPITISLQESLLGFEHKHRHLDGHVVSISTESVTKHGQVLKVEGEGMPLRDDPSSFGDLYLKVTVDFPKKLDQRQRGLVEQALGKPPVRPMT